MVQNSVIVGGWQVDNTVTVTVTVKYIALPIKRPEAHYRVITYIQRSPG